MSAHVGWLIASLKEKAAENHRQAARCRKAYKTDPWRTYCETLAQAYDEAAAVFERRLLGLSPGDS